MFDLSSSKKARFAAQPVNPFPVPTYHLSFDGADDKIVIPASASLNNLPLGDFTVEFSAVIPSASEGIVLGKNERITGGGGIVIWKDASPNSLYISWWDNATTWWVEFDITPPSDGLRHHFEFIWNSVIGKVFIGGIEQVLTFEGYFGENTLYDDSSYDLTIMEGSNYGMIDPVAGKVNWLRISNIARHTSNFTPPSLTIPPATDANTVLLLALDEGIGSAVGDTSGNGNNGVITGAAWIAD